MQDRDILTIARQFIAALPHSRALGMRLEEMGEGWALLAMAHDPKLVGDPQTGVIHGGAVSALMDTALGAAVLCHPQAGFSTATLDLRIDYMRPATPGQTIRARAECHHVTRSVAFVRAEVWQTDRSQPIATAQATFMLSTPAGTPRPRPGAADAAAPPPAPAPASAASAWQPPSDSLPVLPGTTIPYVDYLGIRRAGGADPLLFRMPHQDKLIGNPMLPALHGGVIAGFAETAATLHLIRTLRGAKFPKSIDFSIDYLRSGRPEETFADCEIVRIGARVAWCRCAVGRRTRGTRSR